MDLSQLHYFRTAARTGNLSQAARELFVTQPNLSRSIARLETELGVPCLSTGRERWCSTNTDGFSSPGWKTSSAS